jgi:hypothetical protein
MDKCAYGGVMLSRVFVASVVLVTSVGLTPQTTSGAAEVYLNQAGLTSPTKPPHVELGSTAGCGSVSYSAEIVKAAWDAWGGSAAAGTGTVSMLTDTLDRKCAVRHEKRAEFSVSITADRAETCLGQAVYTHLIATPSSGTAPAGFDKVREIDLPCEVRAALFPRWLSGSSTRDLRREYAQADCALGDFWGATRGAGPFTRLCRMRFQNWGQAAATGTGSIRTTFVKHYHYQNNLEYGTRIRLSKPRWCGAVGMSYTRIDFVAYGPGYPLIARPNGQAVTEAEARRDLRDVRRKRGPRHSGTLTLSEKACTVE